MKYVLLFILSVLISKSFSQILSGCIEYKEKIQYFQFQPEGNPAIYYAKIKILTNGEKLKSFSERDWTRDGHVYTVVNIIYDGKFFTIDSVNQSVSEVHNEKPTVLEQLEPVGGKHYDKGKPVITNIQDTILGIVCNRYIKKEDLEFDGQSSYIETEYHLTKKYGNKFKFDFPLNFMEGYGLILKSSMISYENDKKKKINYIVDCEAIGVKEMPIDEKEFELPEGWPVRSINVTSFMRNVGPTRK